MTRTNLLLADAAEGVLAELPRYARHYVPFLVGILLQPESDIDLLVSATSSITVPIMIACRDLGTLRDRILSVVTATPELTDATLLSDSADWVLLLAELKQEGLNINLIASRTSDLFLHADTIGHRAEKGN